MMTEKPILFSGQMVRAILAGRKTQTRRIVKPQPKHRIIVGDDLQSYDADGINPGRLIKWPYNCERLWVRETWCDGDEPGTVLYRADDDCGEKWKPAIFMPRGASRITLEIVYCYAERLQSITKDGAIAEGFELGIDPRYEFGVYWDKLQKNHAHKWHSNPWVWVIHFRVQSPRQNAGTVIPGRQHGDADD